MQENLSWYVHVVGLCDIDRISFFLQYLKKKGLIISTISGLLKV